MSDVLPPLLPAVLPPPVFPAVPPGTPEPVPVLDEVPAEGDVEPLAPVDDDGVGEPLPVGAGGLPL